MTIEQLVLERLRELTPEKRKEVLDFAESLKHRDGKEPRRSLRGLWRNLDIDITEEDLAQARREMWGTSRETFPDVRRP